MKNLIFIILISISASSCSQLGALLQEPSALETVSALKEVLNSSSFKAIQKLKQVSDNGTMSLLPEEIQPVLRTLGTLGLGNEVTEVTKSIERASGIVAAESGLIMKDAISELKFGDAVAVVVGGQDAATQVLREAMYGSVKKRYSTQLDAELNKTDANKYWPMAAAAYNMFSKNDVDSSLSDFVAERSVDALFLTMGKQETEIRRDPSSLGKAVVTKVFDYYANKK
jgi:hypothetical protein